MKKNRLLLCKRSFNMLMDYFFSNNSLSLHNEKRLLMELEEANVVGKDRLPLNVVSAECRVLVWNITKGQTFNVSIVPKDVDGKDNRISASDPLAIALLGYTAGSIIEWELDDGINRLQVLSVDQPNEVETYEI